VNVVVQVALIASVFIVAAGVLGVSLANARNAQKSQVDALYEKENSALRLALDRQEGENQRISVKYDEIAKANLVLQSTVSGAEEVRKLAVEIASEEKKRQEEHATMMILLKDLIAEFRNSRGAIGR
jgi:hypothetical protein